MKKAKLVAAVVAGLLVGAGGVGVYEYSRATSNVARVAFCLADVKNAPVEIMVKQGSKTLVTANYSFPGTWTSAPIGNVSGPITIEVAGQSRTSALTAKPGEVAVFSQGNCPAWHDPIAAS